MKKRASNSERLTPRTGISWFGPMRKTETLLKGLMVNDEIQYPCSDVGTASVSVLAQILARPEGKVECPNGYRSAVVGLNLPLSF